MSLKEFAEKLNTDSELAVKVKAAENSEQVVEIAKAAGYNISLEDLEQLSDEDLDNVAGGFFINKIKDWLISIKNAIS